MLKTYFTDAELSYIYDAIYNYLLENKDDLKDALYLLKKSKTLTQLVKQEFENDFLEFDKYLCKRLNNLTEKEKSFLIEEALERIKTF